MWILEVHISSSSFESSSSLLADSVTAKFAKTNDVENNFGGTHNDNNNDEDDEDLSPILKILRQGGYDTSISNKAIDRSLLPKWSNILKAYGPPKIYGLQTCQQFQDTVKKSERNIAPAGLFNTGTNLMQHLLKDNCEWETPRRYGGNRWQVPWGKHTPASSRTNHTSYYTGERKPLGLPPYQTTLAVVSIRDPYSWMQSMCRVSYAAQFDHDKSLCPNIKPYPEDIEAHPRFAKMKFVPVWVNYDGNKHSKTRYESIVHLYNEWYLKYVDFENDDDGKNDGHVKMREPSFPFLLVRMEDLVFHGQTVVPQLCKCAGATYHGGDLRHHASVANTNRGVDVSDGIQNGLLRSIIKYGNFTNRRTGYPTFQLEAAKNLLDPRLMRLMSYPYEEP